jgi:hypothetical protein
MTRDDAVPTSRGGSAPTKIYDQHDHLIFFSDPADPEGTPVLEIKLDGRFLVNGKETTNNSEIGKAMRDWFEMREKFIKDKNSKTESVITEEKPAS